MLFVEMLRVRMGQFIWAGLYDDTTCQGWLVGLTEDAFTLKRYKPNGEYMGLLAVHMEMVKYINMDGDDLVRARMEIEANMKSSPETLDKTEFIVSNEILAAATAEVAEEPKPKKRKKKADAKK